MGEVTERIAPELLIKANHLKVCRKIAAVIVGEMANCGITFEQMDYRMGATRGTAKAWLDQLLEGEAKQKSMDHISDLLLTMGAELTMEIHSK